MSEWFWVTGKALDWFESYLTGMCQRIKLSDCLPSTDDPTLGVPRVSVVRPMLFTLYTTPLNSMISGHTISHHLSADNSRLYVSVASGDSSATLNGFQSCLGSVQSWMSTNKLKLNPDKTEFLFIGNERQQSKFLSMFPIELFGVETNPANSSRIPGVIFNKNFTFHSHVSTACSSCFYLIQDQCRIRRHLDLDSAKFLATALASSRLDSCNSLLYGIADTDVTKLQLVQNRLARIVTKSPPFTHSVSPLLSLHWMPVKFRKLFKISLLTYKMFHEKQPVYLHSILAPSPFTLFLLHHSHSNQWDQVPRV